MFPSASNVMELPPSANPTLSWDGALEGAGCCAQAFLLSTKNMAHNSMEMKKLER